MVNKSIHGKQERFGVTIQLVVSQDNDLISAILKLPERGRQAALKTWLRQSQGFEAVSKQEGTIQADHSEAIGYLVDRVSWLQTAMIDLKPYLDGLFANGVMRPIASPFTNNPLVEDERERASQEALKRREERIKGRKWS